MNNKNSEIKFNYELEVAESKDRLWIHCSDGSTVARFGKFGIDLHNDITSQLNGAPECRLCTHGLVTEEDWELFKQKALEFWNVNVPHDSISKSTYSKNTNT